MALKREPPPPPSLHVGCSRSGQERGRRGALFSDGLCFEPPAELIFLLRRGGVGGGGGQRGAASVQRHVLFAPTL